MKNYAKQIGILAIIAVIGFVTAACVEYEDKHENGFSLNSLPGTWKAKGKNGSDEITVTVVFSEVSNGKITMKITEHTVYHGGGGTKVGMTTGHPLIDSIFGLEHHYEGGSQGGSYDTDIWERTYTQAEINALRWELRTLGKNADLYIQYLIPPGECKCERCKPDNKCNDNYSCSENNCDARPRGDLSALIDLKEGLDFKKQ